MKKNIYNFLFCLGGVYGVFMGLAEIYGAYYEYYNQDEFINLFQISKNADHWQFLSIRNLIIWDLFSALVYLSYSVVNFYTFFSKNIYFKLVAIIADIIIITLMIRFHILEVKAGYDHYPGFDPYIF